MSGVIFARSEPDDDLDATPAVDAPPYRRPLRVASRDWATGERDARLLCSIAGGLRLAVYGLRYTDTPVAVIPSEAVNLANEFSTA